MAGRVSSWSVSGDALSIIMDTWHQLKFPIENWNSEVWVSDMIRCQSRKR